MKRLAFVAVFLIFIGLLAGGLLIKPERPDARSLLISAAHAMAEARSMHQSGRADAGRSLLPGRFEIWVSASVIATRYLDKESGMLLASSADLGTLEWSFCDGGTQTLYRADLEPVAEEATRAIAARARFFLTGRIMNVLRANWADFEHSVATERRNGHEVTILTFTWDRDLPLDPPQHVIDRHAFEVDMTTNRLLALRRYFKYDDGSEAMIMDIDRIEYDVPIPTEQELLEPARGVNVVPADAVLESTEGVRYLVLKSGAVKLNPGSAFTTLEVPDDQQ